MVKVNNITALPQLQREVEVNEEERSIDKEAVRAALRAAREQGVKTTTAEIYYEVLPRLFGKKGNWTQVAGFLKELKAEERAAAGEQQTKRPADPLPEEVATALDKGAAAMNICFSDMAGSVSVALTTIKAGLQRDMDLANAAIQAEADRKLAEAEEEVRDAMFAAERIERERDAALLLAENRAVELAAAREALAAEKGRAEELANNAAAAKEEARADRERADLAVQAAADAKAEAARLASEAKAERERAALEVQAAADAKAEKARLSAELRAAGGRKGGSDA
jgi:hypothetical protein